MQSKITRCLVVGFLTATLTAAAFVGESSAQWMAAPYYSPNHAMNVYPAYGWRPFGGLFAGLLCHRCWHSPCCCATPVINPCWTPCFDPCFDPCGDTCGFCGFAADGCGCAGYSGYYDQPTSLTVGVPSSTGFGSVTPSDGIPGQRPVGVPASQKPVLPQTGRTPLTTTPPAGRTSPGNSGTSTSPGAGQPTVAPPRNETAPATPPATSDLDSRLDGIQPRPYTPPAGLGGSTYGTDAADTPPATTGAGSGWYDTPPQTGTGNGTTPATPAGGLPMPAGMGGPGTAAPASGATGGGSTQNLMMDLGSGAISVTVPENAKVYINGYETKMAGVNRRYVVNDLEPGKLYDYEVRIVANVNGRTVEDMQTVTLTGGQQGTLAFGKPQPQLGGPNAYIAARPVQ